MSGLDGKTLLFLGGAERSGTSWLQLMLATHPAIVSGPETHLFSSLIRPAVTKYTQLAEQGFSEGLHRYFDRSQFLAELLCPVAETVLARIAQADPAASVILEKTPGHMLSAGLIDAVLAERRPRFLHLVRDPRAVFASRKAAAREDWGAWADMPPGKFAQTWLSFHRDRQNNRDLLGDRYLELRYEDLRHDTPRVLGQLLGWLQIPASDGVLAEMQQKNALDQLQTAGEDDAARQFYGTRGNFFRSGKTDGWRSELTPAEIAAIDNAAGDVMVQFGYAPDGTDAGRQGRIA